MRIRSAAVAVLLACFGVAWAGPTTQPATADDELRAQALALLAGGKQVDAEEMVFDCARARPTPEIDFFAGVLLRSRFYIDEAGASFSAVAKARPQTVAGQASKLVVAIDRGQSEQVNFRALDTLAAAHADDPLLLWLVAIECRQLHTPKIGIERYRQLLKTFDPGPSMAHQTFGNLLMEDRQPAEALKQYDAAIATEPGAWDYNGRANALTDLDRYAEATAAYRTATELDPDGAYIWDNWASLCGRQNDIRGGFEKHRKAAEIRRRRS